MMKHHTAFYLLTIVIFGAALWVVLLQGKTLESGRVLAVSGSDVIASHQTHIFSELERNARHPLAVMIIQILCIMVVARAFGQFMTKIGQPSVVGEIIAGIALGPSLMGAVFPEFSAFLFPTSSLQRLHVLSQIGLVLFMFVIGMELDVGVLKKKAKAAVIVSHASIIFPYFLGVVLAYFLYAQFAPEKIPFSAFALFMGIAMSITAFPVLARIVQERNLTHTPLGTVIITCAAADDVTAWCLLALVVAIVSAGGMMGAVGSIVLSVLYVLFMWYVVRPILRRMAVKYDTPESINRTVVAAVFGILFLSSYLTELIGIHALFGAFLAGVVMPPQKEFKRILAEKIEDVSLVVLLPLFFVFTGLRTQIGLLNQTSLLGVCVLIIGVAVLGKFVGSAVAAKFVGQSWKDSLLIGVLMNTRGLMELVVLNIGYDLGVLSAEIFTMMVLMALATTFMTGPAIDAIEFFFKSKKPSEEPVWEPGFHALMFFGAPKSGSRLLELAHALNLTKETGFSATAVHFSSSADISIIEAEFYEREAFAPIHQTAERFEVPLREVFRVTDHAEKGMVEMVQAHHYDVVLVGSSRELFKDDKAGGKIRTLIHHSSSEVGVFIDKGFSTLHRMLCIVSGVQDIFLLKYAKRFLEHTGNQSVAILDQERIFPSAHELLELSKIELKGNFSLIDSLLGGNSALEKQYDLVVASFNFWEGLRKQQGAWLNRMPSALIISHRPLWL